LLFRVPEPSACIWVSGFTSIPGHLEEVVGGVSGKYPNVSAQFADLDKVPGSRYLYLAGLNAIKSFKSKPISKSLGMEMLLYIAANRQISEAIRLVGITSETKRITAILIGKTEQGVSEAAGLLCNVLKQNGSDSLVETWSVERIRNVRSIYGIGPKELKATLRANERPAEAVERLAIERSALLTIGK
jgi:tRNA threonylcarbamoyladenosine modification (KEOPS) complex Cgi121 subunit